MRKNISIILKVNIIIWTLLGECICLISASYDGYGHWSKRLLYFTNLSNIWLFLATLLILLPIKNKYRRTLYINRYIFTVAITLTAIIFCCVLAPYADASYHAWSTSGVITHVVVPVVAVADFFVDKEKVFISKKEILACLIPGLIYTFLCTMLFFFNFDFGRGDNFPYFFFNYFSPAGLFGFSRVFPYVMGSFYWLTLIILTIILVALLYAKINNFALARIK